MRLEERSDTEEEEIDDLFDRVLAMDDASVAAGAVAGRAAALKTAADTARAEGGKMGLELGEELGFYQGCRRVWAAALAAEAAMGEGEVRTLPKRALRVVDALGAMLDGFDFDAMDQEVPLAIEGIRARHRQAASLLGGPFVDQEVRSRLLFPCPCPSLTISVANPSGVPAAAGLLNRVSLCPLSPSNT